MGAANDDFVTKMKQVFAGRRTRLPNAHAAAKANHSTLLGEMDTHWTSMTTQEKQACANLFTAAAETGAKTRVPTGLTWPRYSVIDPDDAADLKTRYTV